MPEGFQFNQYQSVYAGSPLDELKNLNKAIDSTGQVLDTRNREVKSGIDAVEVITKSAIMNEQDKSIRDRMIAKVDKAFKDVHKTGRYENSTRILESTVKDIKTDPLFKAGLMNYQAGLDEDAKKASLTNPITMTNLAKHATENEDGTANYYKSEVIDGYDYTDAQINMWASAKADKRALGLSETDFNQLQFGNITEFGEKKINKLMDDMFTLYMNSTEGKQQLRVLTTPNSTNNFGEPLTKEDAEKLIKQQLRSAGNIKQQKEVNLSYKNNPLMQGIGRGNEPNTPEVMDVLNFAVRGIKMGGEYKNVEALEKDKQLTTDVITSGVKKWKDKLKFAFRNNKDGIPAGLDMESFDKKMQAVKNAAFTVQVPNSDGSIGTQTINPLLNEEGEPIFLSDLGLPEYIGTDEYGNKKDFGIEFLDLYNEQQSYKKKLAGIESYEREQMSKALISQGITSSAEDYLKSPEYKQIIAEAERKANIDANSKVATLYYDTPFMSDEVILQKEKSRKALYKQYKQEYLKDSPVAAAYDKLIEEDHQPIETEYVFQRGQGFTEDERSFNKMLDVYGQGVMGRSGTDEMKFLDSEQPVTPEFMASVDYARLVPLGIAKSDRFDIGMSIGYRVYPKEGKEFKDSEFKIIIIPAPQNIRQIMAKTGFQTVKVSDMVATINKARKTPNRKINLNTQEIPYTIEYLTKTDEDTNKYTYKVEYMTDNGLVNRGFNDEFEIIDHMGGYFNAVNKIEDEKLKNLTLKQKYQTKGVEGYQELNTIQRDADTRRYKENAVSRSIPDFPVPSYPNAPVSIPAQYKDKQYIQKVVNGKTVTIEVR